MNVGTLDSEGSEGVQFMIKDHCTLTYGGVTMWRQFLVVVGLLGLISMSACSFENSPKRLPAYLTPVSATGAVAAASRSLPNGDITGALVVINDTSFEKSAPGLQLATRQSLGGYLQAEIQKQLPIQLSSVVYPEGLQPNGSTDQFIQLAKDQGVSYLLLAVLSSSEWEVPDRLPLSGFQQPTGMRSGGLVGYRAENYARVELAFLDGRTGQPIVTTDGQAWATLERLAVPLESNVYPVVRRAETQPPIYPHSESDAFETLRWVSGQDAIAQAVMHLGEVWKKDKVS